MISKSSRLFCFILAAMLFISWPVNSQAQNWTHFRGSSSSGLAESENIPIKWDDSSDQMEKRNS